MRNFGQQANEILQQAGLDESFFSRGNKGFINYFNKIQKKDYKATVTVQEARDNPGKWTTAKATPDVKAAVARS